MPVVQPVILDFLAPQWKVRKQSFAMASSLPSRDEAATTNAKSSKRRRPLTDELRQYLDSAVSTIYQGHSSPQKLTGQQLRVNHAGELAATLIYTAQTPPLTKAHPHLRPLLKHMHDQEAGHFKTFNSLLAKHRIRPTAMYPVWKIAATTLGWSTALMGREAAMACTEAVEMEIGNHYNGQVRVLLEWIRNMEERGEEVGEEIRELVETVRRIRDEELEHLDEAVANDSKLAEGHNVLTNVIRGGCRAAIWISERV